MDMLLEVGVNHTILRMATRVGFGACISTKFDLTGQPAPAIVAV